MFEYWQMVSTLPIKLILRYSGDSKINSKTGLFVVTIVSLHSTQDNEIPFKVTPYRNMVYL